MSRFNLKVTIIILSFILFGIPLLFADNIWKADSNELIFKERFEEFVGYDQPDDRAGKFMLLRPEDRKEVVEIGLKSDFRLCVNITWDKEFKRLLLVPVAKRKIADPNKHDLQLLNDTKVRGTYGPAGVSEKNTLQFELSVNEKAADQLKEESSPICIDQKDRYVSARDSLKSIIDKYAEIHNLHIINYTTQQFSNDHKLIASVTFENNIIQSSSEDMDSNVSFEETITTEKDVVHENPETSTNSQSSEDEKAFFLAGWPVHYLYLAILLLILIIFYLLYRSSKLNKNLRDNQELLNDISLKEKQLEEIKHKPGWNEDDETKKRANKICEKALIDVEQLIDEEWKKLANEYYNFFKTQIGEIKVTPSDRGDFVCNLVNNKGAYLRQYLLSRYLLENCWKTTDDIDEFIKKIYQIASIEASPKIFIYLSEKSFELNNEASHVISIVCDVICDVITSDISLEKHIKVKLYDIRNALERSEDISDLGRTGVKFYDYLMKLNEQIEDSTYSAIEFKPYPEKSLKEHVGTSPLIEFPELTAPSENWRKIREQTERVLQYKSSKIKQLKVLSETEKKLSETGKPDYLYWSAIVKKWKQQLTKWGASPPAPILRIYPAPKLTDEPFHNKGYSEFAILIENHSEGPASNTKIKIMKDGGFVKQLEVKEDIDPRSTIVTDIQPIKEPCGDISLIASCKDYYGKDHKFTYKSMTKFISRNLSFNPYNEDTPYRKGDIFVGREPYEDKLKEIINNNQKGCIIYLWGLRRVGKTSLIHHFIEEKANPSGYFTVYIPCILFEKDGSWEVEDFLGIIARRVELWLIGVEHINKDNIREAPKGKTTSVDFFDYINHIRRELQNKPLMLFFDDAEVFGNKELFPKFDTILKNFKTITDDPSKNMGGFFPVFVGCKDVLGEFFPESVTPYGLNSIEILPLERDETREIVDFDICYDDIAFEYLWRFTGGHPSLTQLICRRVSEACSSDNKSEIVPLSTVRKSVEGIITHNRRYFEYIYRYSIPRHTHTTLSKIVKRVDKKTLAFDIIGFNEEEVNQLENLTHYRIVRKEDHLDNYFLRFGFFMIWIDKFGNKYE